MSEYEDWSRQAAPQTHGSQSSIRSFAARKSLNNQPGERAPHYRNISDVSLDSLSQADDTIPLGRPVSAESRQWLPMHGAGLSSPPADGVGGVDLGSPDLDSPYNAAAAAASPRQSQRSPAFHQSPPKSFGASRPKPTPMQFQDNDQYFPSPGSSYRSAFSPRERFQKNRTATGDSRTYLLNTPTASDWTRTPRTPPAYTSGLPPRKKWWQWRPAWIMYLFLLFGLCCAIGHHSFYATLNGRIADNQLAMLRYGTILSFAAKAGFVAAVITAYRQRIWVTVRNKLLSVGALDSLFAATDDLSALWNMEIYQKAKLAMVLASLVWLTPLVIILTSNTLLVESVENIDHTQCPGVRTLNFTMDELEEFRQPTKIDGMFGLAVNYWNTTDTNLTAEDWFDYYTGPSDVFQAVANLGVYSHQVIGTKNASLDICGTGWNCTFTVEFVAPGYKCEEIASGVGARVRQFGDNVTPFNTSYLIPEGNYSYYAYTSGGEYAQAQMEHVWPGGIPTFANGSQMWPNQSLPEHLGAFRTEPVVWVGYTVRNDINGPTPANSSVAGWMEAFTPKIFACENYETAYTVDFKYEGQDQFTNVTKREFLSRVVNTTYVKAVDAQDGTNDNTTAVPESNYVYPRDLHRYRRVSTFHSLGSMLRNAINGTITSNPVGIPQGNTKALQTKLLDPRQEWFPYADLQNLVQDLFEDIILSLFSNYRMVSLTWAAKPWETTGDLKGDDSTLWPCTRSRWENRYKYVARDLWIVYSCAFLCAVTAVVLGTAAVFENEGRLYDTRFSSIVAATRGPALEKVMWKEDKGDLPSGVRNLKVGYGLIHRVTALGDPPEDTRYPGHTMGAEEEMPRFGFGLEGDVRQIRSEGSLFRGRTH